MAPSEPARRKEEEESRGVKAEREQARRRHVLSEALALLDTDALAARAIRWCLVREPWPELWQVPAAPNSTSLNKFLRSKGINMKELHLWLMALVGGHASREGGLMKGLVGILDWIDRQDEKVSGKYEMSMEPLVERLKQRISSGPPKTMNGKETMQWMQRVFGDYHPQGEGLSVLHVLSPPACEDDVSPHDDFSASQLGRRVYNHPLAVKNFDCRVCIDANIYRQRKERLHQLLLDLTSSSGCPAADLSCNVPAEAIDETELETRIREHLRGKRFLIILNDPEDDSAWEHIRKALPASGDFSNGSAVMVTPSMAHQQDNVDGWIIANLVFSQDHLPYKVHLHFLDIVAVCKKAAELCNSDVVPIVTQILETCCTDYFSTKMVFHALYADPHRSKVEWDKLLHGVNELSTTSNARHIIRFCYDNLPSSYRNCLLYLCIFPPNSIITRTSLVRRWVTERLITRRYGLNALDEAERCFDALVDRCLLVPGFISREGKVKSCTVHPQVLSFISKMPRDVAGVDGNTDLPLDLACHLSLRHGIQMQMLTRKKRADRHSNNCMALLKSFTATEESENSEMDILTVLNLLSAPQLGLIKVLDLEGCPGLNKKHLKNICNKIFQLKYLSIRNTDIEELPKEVEKLQDLEVFVIKQTKIQAFPAKSIILRKLVYLLAQRPRQGCHENW